MYVLYRVICTRRLMADWLISSRRLLADIPTDTDSRVEDRSAVLLWRPSTSSRRMCTQLSQAAINNINISTFIHCQSYESSLNKNNGDSYLQYFLSQSSQSAKTRGSEFTFTDLGILCWPLGCIWEGTCHIELQSPLGDTGIGRWLGHR